MQYCRAALGDPSGCVVMDAPIVYDSLSTFPTKQIPFRLLTPANSLAHPPSMSALLTSALLYTATIILNPHLLKTKKARQLEPPKCCGRLMCTAR